MAKNSKVSNDDYNKMNKPIQILTRKPSLETFIDDINTISKTQGYGPGDDFLSFSYENFYECAKLFQKLNLNENTVRITLCIVKFLLDKLHHSYDIVYLHKMIYDGICLNVDKYSTCTQLNRDINEQFKKHVIYYSKIWESYTPKINCQTSKTLQSLKEFKLLTKHCYELDTYCLGHHFPGKYNPDDKFVVSDLNDYLYNLILNLHPNATIVINEYKSNSILTDTMIILALAGSITDYKESGEKIIEYIYTKMKKDEKYYVDDNFCNMFEGVFSKKHKFITHVQYNTFLKYKTFGYILGTMMKLDSDLESDLDIYGWSKIEPKNWNPNIETEQEITFLEQMRYSSLHFDDTF